MTREEIEKLDGEALNAAVAEHVMGWTRHDPTASYPWESPDRPHPPGTAIMRHHLQPPHYSTDIAAAWQVVERIINLRNLPDVKVWFHPYEREWWCAWRDSSSKVCEASADTVPVAICRCALLAVFATPATAAGKGAK